MAPGTESSGLGKTTCTLDRLSYLFEGFPRFGYNGRRSILDSEFRARPLWSAHRFFYASQTRRKANDGGERVTVLYTLPELRQTQKDGHQRNGSWACFRITFCHWLVYNPLRSTYGGSARACFFCWEGGLSIKIYALAVWTLWFCQLLSKWGNISWVLSEIGKCVLFVFFSVAPNYSCTFILDPNFDTRGQSVGEYWEKEPGKVSMPIFFASWPRPSSRSSRVH